MTDKINDGGSAFPLAVEYSGYPPEFGMSLRDYFAAKAMEGDWAAQGGEDVGIITPDTNDEVLMNSARLYYRMADAMLAAREVKHD